MTNELASRATLLFVARHALERSTLTFRTVSGLGKSVVWVRRRAGMVNLGEASATSPKGRHLVSGDVGGVQTGEVADDCEGGRVRGYLKGLAGAPWAIAVFMNRSGIEIHGMFRLLYSLAI